ncbi:MAG: hypothetical protein IPK97_15880 [Ahniella sp.]|nr:hypothetical protein [Ahniella sp.]
MSSLRVSAQGLAALAVSALFVVADEEHAERPQQDLDENKPALLDTSSGVLPGEGTVNFRMGSKSRHDSFGAPTITLVRLFRQTLVLKGKN